MSRRQDEARVSTRARPSSRETGGLGAWGGGCHADAGDATKEATLGCRSLYIANVTQLEIPKSRTKETTTPKAGDGCGQTKVIATLSQGSCCLSQESF